MSNQRKEGGGRGHPPPYFMEKELRQDSGLYLHGHSLNGPGELVVRVEMEDALKSSSDPYGCTQDALVVRVEAVRLVPGCKYIIALPEGFPYARVFWERLKEFMAQPGGGMLLAPTGSQIVSVDEETQIEDAEHCEARDN